MKIKTIIWMFNIVILFSFLFVFFMPVFFLGWDYSRTFWSANWYLVLLFAAVLALLNGYFRLNWSLFSALERESWNDVAAVLEKRIFERNRRTISNVRILVNSYIVTSRTADIARLETDLRNHAPSVLTKTCLLFGITHLLTNSGEDIERYYGEFREKTRGAVQRWTRWHYAFGLLLLERVDEAKVVLTALLDENRDELLTAFTCFLLDPVLGSEDPERTVLTVKTGELRDRNSPARWKQMTERRKNEIHVLVLSRLLQDIEAWLFPPPTKTS